MWCVSAAQNPFYKKETREIFRQLFGPPDDRRTFMKVSASCPSSPPPPLPPFGSPFSYSLHLLSPSLLLPPSSSLPQQVLCGLPVYIKFAGAAVAMLRRWLTADDIPSDETREAEFLANVHR